MIEMMYWIVVLLLVLAVMPTVLILGIMAIFIAVVNRRFGNPYKR